MVFGFSYLICDNRIYFLVMLHVVPNTTKLVSSPRLYCRMCNFKLFNQNRLPFNFELPYLLYSNNNSLTYLEKMIGLKYVFLRGCCSRDWWAVLDLDIEHVPFPTKGVAPVVNAAVGYTSTIPLNPYEYSQRPSLLFIIVYFQPKQVPFLCITHRLPDVARCSKPSRRTAYG